MQEVQVQTKTLPLDPTIKIAGEHVIKDLLRMDPHRHLGPILNNFLLRSEKQSLILIHWTM